jgi:apolipoprotein D and lipocalin family protein
MQRKLIIASLLAATTLLGACTVIQRPAPVGNINVPGPAKPVDLTQYLGLWFEQFRYDAPFQKDMDGVTANYVMNSDGTVRVINRGRRGSKWKESVGRAKPVKGSSNAKLKVSFFGPFYGNYWVLDHGDDYSWSIVGEPSGRYLWVLTRDQHPSDQMKTELAERVRRLGYDWSLVRVTRQ